MDAKRLQAWKPAVPPILRLAGLLALALIATAISPCSAGEEFRETFEGERPTCAIRLDSSQARLLAHRIHDGLFHSGRASENVKVESASGGAILRIEHTLPPSRAIDDLDVSLWVRSNRSGAVLALRLVFPNQQHTETGDVLTATLLGDMYTKPREWQQLHCRTTDKQLLRELQLLRGRLKTDIDTQGMYVDRLILAAELGAGVTDVFMDDLHAAPIVATADAAVQQAAHEESVRSPVEFRLDRLLVAGVPFFPRVVPDHGESAGTLAGMNFNVGWVPDFQDGDRLNELRRQGLWATAVPPRAVGVSGELLKAEDASLIPFSHETGPILFWMMGARVPEARVGELRGSIVQVQSADRDVRRPVAVDVAGAERIVSREERILLSASRHALHTSFSLGDCRQWLAQRRNMAIPGTFFWTWIQTEPAPEIAMRRAGAERNPMIIEPELYRLQGCAALAAGCRALGYWTTTSLEGDLPGHRERRLALTQLNLEWKLLEPWLATGRLMAVVPFSIAGGQTEPARQLSLPFGTGISARLERDAQLRSRDARLRESERLPGELRAAILRSDFGVLILPIWLQENAQFVPGHMAGNEATIIVPGADEFASAWEVTTTGIRNLPPLAPGQGSYGRQRVKGGLKVVLPKLDQTAAIVLTSDPALVTRLREKIAEIQEQSAQVTVELAEAKLERVRAVDAQLVQLGVGEPDAHSLLGSAASWAARARNALGSGDFHGAREAAANSLQLVRILQRAHWERAVRTLSSPVASPHTLCFETLPDHWRLMARLGRSHADGRGNLLPCGDFEVHNAVEMVQAGWKHSQESSEGIHATAELFAHPRSGSYCLRLIAIPASGQDPPLVVEHPPATVQTPSIPVRAGQILHISGWVRVMSPISTNLDGAVLYDSILGRAGAIRWREAQDWKRFELIREADRDDDFSLTIALCGLGEIRVDDLQVIAHDPLPETATEPASTELEVPPRPSPLSLLPKLPVPGRRGN